MTQTNNLTNRDDRIQDLTDLMESFINEQETYFTEDDTNPYAEAVLSSPDSLAELHLNNLSDDVADLVSRLRALSADDDEFRKALLDCTELESIHGLVARNDEVFTLPMGETFIEWPTEITDLIAALALTDDETNALVTVFVTTGGVYLDLNYNRWSLVLDSGLLTDAIDARLTDLGLTNLEVFESNFELTESDDGETNLTLLDGPPDTDARFFYWFSLPGCLPESEPFGPFDSAFEALNNAAETFGRWD